MDGTYTEVTVNHITIHVHSHLMLLVRDTCWLQCEAVSVELVNNGRRLHCREKLFMPLKNHEVSHSLGRPLKSRVQNITLANCKFEVGSNADFGIHCGGLLLPHSQTNGHKGIEVIKVVV